MSHEYWVIWDWLNHCSWPFTAMVGGYVGLWSNPLPLHCTKSPDVWWYDIPDSHSDLAMLASIQYIRSCPRDKVGSLGLGVPDSGQGDWQYTLNCGSMVVLLARYLHRITFASDASSTLFKPSNAYFDCEFQHWWYCRKTRVCIGACHCSVDVVDCQIKCLGVKVVRLVW